MKIKKMYQGQIPENKILNVKSNSQIDTYSCDYVNKLNDYSIDEVITGNWIDGKPIYKKIIDVGSLPNNSTKQINSGLTNVIVRNIYGCANNEGNTALPLPCVRIDASQNVALWYYYPSNYITIQTASDRSAYSGYVVLEYTKTTD